ncbi:MAG: sugar phosphate isomerase/epimerase, partial [bacterium]|nr:sugar phosphate isomerase/epimerase [bacterium]MDW8163418.1 TIM barrel protein [Candidatus Omnitrophota bacterium]
MKLGGPVFEKYTTPEEWINLLKKEDYKAGYCPVDLDTPEEIIHEYWKLAFKEKIIIAEVGTWCNPLSSEIEERKKAIEKCKKGLYLAEKIGANCCVNISGSRGKKWDGPDKKNLTRETFDMIVKTVREIIDEIKPKNTYYTLETMPWMYPDSADIYLKLIKAIDRKSFAVHFDPVNLINTPKKYFFNDILIKDFIKKLGFYIKSCHAKDIIIREKLTLHLEEIRPGLGNLNYRILLKELNKLDKNIPLMLEHLPSYDEYKKAKEHIRKIA